MKIISSSKLFWLSLFSLFFLIAAILYSPSLGGPWQYDDYAQILDNQVLTGRSLPKLLSSTFRFTAHSDGWTGTRDLVRASFLVNWQWWGNDPSGYRWVNLLIHVINATLVTSLIYLLLKITCPTSDGRSPGGRENLKLKIEISILSGLIFLVHPLNSQAVAYVAQRFTSMATMFYLGAIVSWLLFLKSRFHYSLLFTSYFLALLAFNSKEIAVTLPVTLALVAFIAAPGISNATNATNATNKPINANKHKEHRWVIGLLGYWKLVILLLPFFLLSLKIPLQIVSSSYGSTGKLSELTTVAVDSFALKQKAVDLTRHDYFLTQINVVGTYLRLAVLPVRQTLDYDYPVTKSFDPKTIVLAVFHLSLIGFSILLIFNPFNFSSHFKHFNHSYLRLIGLGVLWFYLTLLPESSVVPIADLIYEHRAYLPMVGLIIAMTGVIAQVKSSLPADATHQALQAGKFKIQKFPFYFLLITLYSLLSIATLRRPQAQPCCVKSRIYF